MKNETILLKAYELLKYLIPILKKFPREQRFQVADRMQSIASDVLEQLIAAYYLPASHRKKEILENVNIKLEVLRYYVRLCFELGFYSSLKMKEINEHIDEIGRMTGGWLKALR